MVDAFGGFPACWRYIRAEARKYHSSTVLYSVVVVLYIISVFRFILIRLFFVHTIIEKLKDSGLAFSELPKVRTVRKKKTSTSSALDGDSSTIEEVSPGSGCASRLLAINGVGPRAVEALLSYATAVETVELVEGLLQHVSFTSTANSSVMTGTTAVAQTLSEEADSQTVSTTTSTRTSPECDPAPAIKMPASVDLPLAGRVVVFTGKLESGMPRHDAEALCTLLGECVQHLDSTAVVGLSGELLL